MKKTDREKFLYEIFSKHNIILEKQRRYSRYKVDFKYELSDKYDIIIECDEWNHCDKPLYDEVKRMIQIKDISNKKIIFIRFSSDVQYKYRGKLGYKFNLKIFLKRIHELILLFKKILKNPNKLKYNMYIIYLFYYPTAPKTIHRFIDITFTNFTDKIKNKLEEEGHKDIILEPRDTAYNIYKKYKISTTHLDFHVSRLYFFT